MPATRYLHTHSPFGRGSAPHSYSTFLPTLPATLPDADSVMRTVAVYFALSHGDQLPSVVGSVAALPFTAFTTRVATFVYATFPLIRVTGLHPITLRAPTAIPFCTACADYIHTHTYLP